ncbi:hypothetical protein R1sor_024130 [Riccia sorocarpa]|uniref:Reverse transcriptase domain-containing protein n=1 Tax=Riccia sorocarpa TaxID=122646 RepID=A0ABD3GTM4_9MARC
MAAEAIAVATWNVLGMGDLDRVDTIRNWLKTKARQVKVLALQELKAAESVIEVNIRKIMDGAHCIVDYSPTDRGGAALLIHPSLKLHRSGVKGDGTFAWAIVDTDKGRLGFASIYGPHKGREKVEMFEWLKQFENGGRWLVLGDWNMVTDVKDSIGPTPLLKGEALCKWQEVDTTWDFLDLYHCAGVTEGPFYTRQVWRGDRLDQSRLDRIYANNNGEWIKSVWKVKHFGKEALSDHIPVSVELQTEGEDGVRLKRKKRGSYTKLDAECLSKPEYLDRVKLAWEEGYSLSPDPIIRWSLAWSRVQREYKIIRGEMQSKLSKLDTKKEKLEEIRLRLSEGADFYDQIDMVEYTQLEGEVKAADLLRASIWRRRSRYKWLQLGEASSKFFFKTLKAKQNGEKMNSLKLTDGTIITQEEQILDKVKDYYKKLYTRDEEVERARVERAEILKLVDRSVLESDNIKLTATPPTEEIDKTVTELPKEKAPGKDGITAEVLRATWSWTREACVALIEGFWRTKRLGLAEAEGVIKLLPKSQEKQLLTNWRPITLLSIAYKIISKILANRLKGIIPRLVDAEQTGFVENRNIVENILCLRLGQDLAEVTKQKALFCKLDFAKAFDRVSHTYLWETLGRMGFSEEFLQLTRGLVSSGSSKVQVNGLFTTGIALQRGVRQGCPISPLLFALSTQPLMRLLREEEKAGRLIGMSIPNGRPLLHRFFADDSGIGISATEENFENLKNIITRFEEISGAKLNVSKSTILPMALGPIPQWLRDTGCQIVEGNDRMIYLGYKAGMNLSDKDHARDLAEKLVRKLANWSHRLLTWPGRVTLLRHILRAIPVYQFLNVGLRSEGYKQLERICASFLWGLTDEGKARTSLIGWADVVKEKKEGGLGFTPFETTAAALKMRFVAKLLEGDKSEWAVMLRFFIRCEMQKKAHGKEARYWSTEEGLFLIKTFTGSKSVTASHFLRSWTEVRKHLTLSTTEVSLPASLSLTQLKILLQQYWKAPSFCCRTVYPLLKRLGVSHLIHLKNGENQWRNLQAKLTGRRIPTTAEQRREISRFEVWRNKLQLDSTTLQASTSWRWGEDNEAWTGWNKPCHFWVKLLRKEPPEESLQRRWIETCPLLTWKRRWAEIWSGGTHPRLAIWFWKIYRRGFFTGERASRMKVSVGTCERCHQHKETLTHLFCKCREVKSQWTTLQRIISTTRTTPIRNDCLLTALDEAVIDKRRKESLWFVMAAFTHSIWLDRNHKVFRGKRRSTPVRQILKMAQDELEASMETRKSEERWSSGIQALAELRSWIHHSEARIATTRIFNIRCKSNKRATLIRAAPFEDQSLLVRRNSILVLNLGFTLSMASLGEEENQYTGIQFKRQEPQRTEERSKSRRGAQAPSKIRRSETQEERSAVTHNNFSKE